MTATTEEDGDGEKKPNATERLGRLLGFGRYQMFQAYVFVGVLSFVGAWDAFQLIFVVTDTPARCALPDQLEQR